MTTDLDEARQYADTMLEALGRNGEGNVFLLKPSQLFRVQGTPQASHRSTRTYG